MAYAYPFFAFCSAVLNDPNVRNQFMTPDLKNALIASYGLTRTQIAAAESRDIRKIMGELEKELSKVARSSRAKRGFIIW